VGIQTQHWSYESTRMLTSRDACEQCAAPRAWRLLWRDPTRAWLHKVCPRGRWRYLVAADYAVRAEGMPALSLMEAILERKVKLSMMGDNEAMTKICHSGNSPTMRYLNRVRQVGVSWLMEIFGLPTINIYKIDTDQVAGCRHWCEAYN
jgi:hypothetical protein